MMIKPTYEELEQRIQALETAESRLKRAEDALRESEARYRELLERTAELAQKSRTLEDLYSITARQSEEVLGINRAISGFIQAMTVEETCAILTQTLTREFAIPRVILGLKHEDAFEFSRAEGFLQPISQEAAGHCLGCKRVSLQLLSTGRRVKKKNLTRDDLACDGLFLDCFFLPLKGKTQMLGVLVLFQGEAARNSITLDREIDPVLPQIMADEARLGQVLVNLLSNAIKFTPRGVKYT